MLAERLTAQLLAGPPAGDPLAVTRHLLAVQAQDARGARLAIRVRTADGIAADVDRALTEDRSVVISWFCRGTLHLVAAEDYHWLHALTTPPLMTACLRRLGQEGVSTPDAERAVEVVKRSIAEDGPLTRPELKQRIDAVGVRTEAQALIHILFLATLRGLVVRGPLIGRQHAYALVRDWLGPPPPTVDRRRALAELARRYLVGHWPASDRDLARWSGLPLRDARAGLDQIAGELADRDDGQLALRAAPPAADLPPPRLLGPWDPLSVGWKDRSFVMAEHDAAVITGGLFRPFALAGGQAVAVWKLAHDEVILEPFRRVSSADRIALDADADAVKRYLRLGGSERA